MALVFKDRVKETTTTSGTGTITLAGAVSSFQTFSVIGDGNTTYYTIVSGTDWEVGIGTYTLSGTTLSRDTILESSNGGSAISLSGTSTVFCTYAAEKSVYRNSNDQINVTASGLIFSDSTVQTTAAAVSGDNVSIFVNDTGYLTNTSSDFTYVSGVAVYGSGHTLQTVTDNGNNTTNSILTSGNVTATTGYFDTFDMTLLGNGSQPPHLEGRLFYDSENHTVTMYNDEPDVSLQIGQELYVRVRNETPDDIPNGSVVRINGSHGSAAPTIVLASADSEENSQVAGFATHTIESNSFGYISTFGLVRGVDTDGGMSDGDGLFLSVTSGEYVNVDPGIPYYSVELGRVIVSHPSNGIIFVNIGKRKLSGGDLKSVTALNQSGVPFVTYIADTNAGGVTTVSDFVYDSGNSALYVNNKQVITSGDNVSLLNNDAGYLTTHPAISAASDSDNSGRTYIQDLLLDSYGHVTGISTATETVVDTDTTYTAGSGLQLNGTTFDALTATTSTSGITTLTNTIDGTETKALTPKAVNDAGYLTAESDTLQTVVDRGNTSTTDITVSGLLTAATGVTLEQNTPATTTDKLYNVGGSLYFNGSAVDTDTTYAAGSGLELSGTTFNAKTATTSASGITTLTNTIDSTETKALTPKAVNDAGYVVGPASSTDNAIARFDGTTGKLIQDTSGAIIDDNNILTVNGLQIGGANWWGLDSEEFAAIPFESGTPPVLTFNESALNTNYVYTVRLTNRETTDFHGSSYIVYDNSGTWDTIQLSEAGTSTELPLLMESGGSVYVYLKGPTASLTGGSDFVTAHMTSHRVDQPQADGDKLSLLPEFVFSNRKNKAAGVGQARQIFPTQDGQSTAYHFGLGTQTNPTAALDVGGNSLFSGTVAVTGLITAATGITLQNNLPSTTTDKLYNNGGNLYFNGLQLATSTSADWTIADGNGNSEVVSSGDTIYFSGIAGTDVTYDAATNIVSISGGYNPVVSETGTSRTLAIGDAGLYIRTTNASAVTITVPSGLAPPANAEFVFEQAGAGQITISPAAGVTINTSTSLTSSTQYAVLGIKQVATDVYTAFGDRT